MSLQANDGKSMTASKRCHSYDMSSRTSREQSNSHKTRLNDNIYYPSITDKSTRYVLSAVNFIYSDSLSRLQTSGYDWPDGRTLNVHPLYHIIHKILEHVIWKLE